MYRIIQVVYAVMYTCIYHIAIQTYSMDTSIFTNNTVIETSNKLIDNTNYMSFEGVRDDGSYKQTLNFEKLMYFCVLTGDYSKLEKLFFASKNRDNRVMCLNISMLTGNVKKSSKYIRRIKSKWTRIFSCIITWCG